MALRLTEASSSDCPPDRKTTPGMAGGTVLDNAVTVALPTSAGEALTAADWPGVTMLGLSREPSRYTWWSLRALYTAARTVSVTFWHRSRLWSPSHNTSGSTIGTIPAAWHVAAYLIHYTVWICYIGWLMELVKSWGLFWDTLYIIISSYLARTLAFSMIAW